MENVKRSLVDSYKQLLSHLLVRRALGLVNAEQEADLAEERVAIWDQLEPDERADLEDWIDSHS